MNKKVPFSYNDYYQIRNEIYAIKDGVTIWKFPLVLFTMAVFFVLYLYLAFASFNIWIRVGALVLLSILFVIILKKLSKSSSYKNKLKNLEDNLFAQTKESVLKQLDNENKQEYLAFLKTAITDDIEDLKTQYNQNYTLLLLSVSVTTLLSCVKDAISYFSDLEKLAQLKETINNQVIDNLLFTAEENLAESKASFEGALIALFSLLVIVGLVNMCESIIKPMLYNKRKKLRYFYTVVQEQIELLSVSSVDSEMPSKPMKDNQNNCDVGKYIYSKENQTSLIRDFNDLFNSINSAVNNKNLGISICLNNEPSGRDIIPSDKTENNNSDNVKPMVCKSEKKQNNEPINTINNSIDKALSETSKVDITNTEDKAMVSESDIPTKLESDEAELVAPIDNGTDNSAEKPVDESELATSEAEQEAAKEQIDTTTNVPDTKSSESIETSIGNESDSTGETQKTLSDEEES